MKATKLPTPVVDAPPVATLEVTQAELDFITTILYYTGNVSTGLAGANPSVMYNQCIAVGGDVPCKVRGGAVYVEDK